MIQPLADRVDPALKTQVITPADISTMVTWYERNWTRINDALPLTAQGTTYQRRWQDVMDRQTLPAWRAGTLGKVKSQAYVYATLKRIRSELDKAV